MTFHSVSLAICRSQPAEVIAATDKPSSDLAGFSSDRSGILQRVCRSWNATGCACQVYARAQNWSKTTFLRMCHVTPERSKPAVNPWLLVLQTCCQLGDVNNNNKVNTMWIQANILFSTLFASWWQTIVSESASRERIISIMNTCSACNVLDALLQLHWLDTRFILYWEDITESACKDAYSTKIQHDRNWGIYQGSHNICLNFRWVILFQSMTTLQLPCFLHQILWKNYYSI